MELGTVLKEIKEAHDKVAEWSRSEKPPFALEFVAMRPVIRKEPKGTVLIIAPFNYPVALSVGPLAGAIAAGNTAVLKISEQTPAVSALVTEVIHKYLDSDVVRVVNGAVAETTKVLELQWDHILYTGGERVGRIVAMAAAKHTTPVSLELGGKSPLIVDPKTDLQTAARRILWGKGVNAGQTCVAPDYILVPRDSQAKLVEALQAAHAQLWPNPLTSSTFSHLVSEAAFDRVHSIISTTTGTVVIGGLPTASKADKFIPLTVVKDVKGDDSLMRDELFGPVLPIVPVDSIEDAVKFVNERPHPLALYVFSNDQGVKDKVANGTQSGAICFNETVIHSGVYGLPFGGTGNSGYGYHTGKYSFDMFTHLRASMDQHGWIDMMIGARFPPYTEQKRAKVASLVFPSLPARPKGPPGGK